MHLYLDPDNPPPPPTEPPVEFLDANVLEQAYDKTSTIHMPSLEQFLTLTDDTVPDIKLTPGPFGFGYAVTLKSEYTQCLKRSPYASSGDCTFDPATCTEGFSVGIWYRANFSYAYFHTVHALHKEPKRYVLSTGGDTDGHPGIAIYHQGLALTGIVSTGDTYWKLEVLGPFANADWTNVGMRWDSENGLELYANAKKVGHSHSSKPSSRKQPLDPNEILVGCHKDSDNTNYRHYHDGDFDEFAFWSRRLPDDETIFFLGGFEGSSENLSPEEFAVMLQRTDLTDPAQAQIALGMLSAMTDQLSGPEGDSSTPSTSSDGSGTATDGTSQAPVIDSGALKLLGMANVFRGMTKPNLVKKDLTMEEMEIYSDVIKVASKILNESLARKWHNTEMVGHEGASMVKADLEKYVKELALKMKFDFPHDPINFTKTTENIVVRIDKMKVEDMEKSGKFIVTPNYRANNAMKEMWRDWNTPADKVQVPSDLYFEKGCKDEPISLVTIYYDSFDDVGPMRIEPESKLSSKVHNEVDSRVVSVFIANEKPPVDATGPPCHFNLTKMIKNPLFYKMEHKQQIRAHRGLKFHELEVTSMIYRRLCVWWNPQKDENGTWDTSGCSLMETTQFFSKCACNHFGTFAIMAEHMEEKEIPPDPSWLPIVKLILYIISAICLIFYVIVVVMSGDLKDQFHISAACLSVSVLGGSIGMILSMQESMQSDRHACTAIGALMHGLYLNGGLCVAVLSHAGFKAVTAGIIVGRLQPYLLIPSGITLITVGISFIFFIHELGTDPRCFMSWYDDVKIILFFLPILIASLVSIFFSIVIFFNLGHARKTKEIVRADYITFITGTTVLSFYYPIVWLFGALTYVHVAEEDLGVFPFFHILNGLMGVVILVCLGICSTKFKKFLTGQAKLRGQLLQKYYKGGKGVAGNKGVAGSKQQKQKLTSEGPGDSRPDSPPPPAIYKPPPGFEVKSL
ncbi:hypothetical protein SK128_016792 [Halocaridina rubra]|uniref:GAIN-B domain-containing protein n=1 Tax=Halocaridina rubra TaxID=373956 RepID=A0AAN8XJ61_HALRR